MGVANRRRNNRRQVAEPQGLQIRVPSSSGPARMLVAKLVDVGEGGVGVETFVPLTEGSVLSVSGDLCRDEFNLRLSGRVRVTYSTEVFPGLYRNGLQFVEVAYARAS